MFLQHFPPLDLWQFELLRQAGIAHFVSGRQGGLSHGEKGSLNLSYSSGDDAAHVKENRRRLCEAMGIAPGQLYFPSQTHGSRVAEVTPATRPEDLQATDALMTSTPGICIAVMSADCVPVLLYDAENQAAAAIHAGWKGTVAKIVTHAAAAMQQQYGTDPGQLVACIGPSICQQSYEVGEEVIAAAELAFGPGHGLVAPSPKEGKGHFNLWEANRLQLLALGVPPARIEVAGLCTFIHSGQFFSARRSREAGRFAAGILLR